MSPSRNGRKSLGFNVGQRGHPLAGRSRREGSEGRGLSLDLIAFTHPSYNTSNRTGRVKPTLVAPATLLFPKDRSAPANRRSGNANRIRCDRRPLVHRRATLARCRPAFLPE